MVLKRVTFVWAFLVALALLILLVLPLGCMTPGGYERYGFYDGGKDRIYEHRASFRGDGNIGMAYAVVYWDVLPQDREPPGKVSEAFYVWLRNDSSSPLSIDPNDLSLRTEGGKSIPLSPLTQSTPAPLTAQVLSPMGIASGYALFEVPESVITSDEPGRLVYEDTKGNRAVRYLQIEGMKRFEGLSLREEVYYYSPVYPRVYWYPYYYPYAYYPFSVDFLYIYVPHRHYYYAVPTPPQRRQFLIPSAPKTRQFKGSGVPGLENEGESGPKKKRQFPGR